MLKLISKSPAWWIVIEEDGVPIDPGKDPRFIDLTQNRWFNMSEGYEPARSQEIISAEEAGYRGEAVYWLERAWGRDSTDDYSVVVLPGSARHFLEERIMDENGARPSLTESAK